MNAKCQTAVISQAPKRRKPTNQANHRTNQATNQAAKEHRAGNTHAQHGAGETKGAHLHYPASQARKYRRADSGEQHCRLRLSTIQGLRDDLAPMQLSRRLGRVCLTRSQQTTDVHVRPLVLADTCLVQLADNPSQKARRQEARKTRRTTRARQEGTRTQGASAPNH